MLLMISGVLSYHHYSTPLLHVMGRCAFIASSDFLCLASPTSHPGRQLMSSSSCNMWCRP